MRFMCSRKRVSSLVVYALNAPARSTMRLTRAHKHIPNTMHYITFCIHIAHITNTTCRRTCTAALPSTDCFYFRLRTSVACLVIPRDTHLIIHIDAATAAATRTTYRTYVYTPCTVCRMRLPGRTRFAFFPSFARPSCAHTFCCLAHLYYKAYVSVSSSGSNAQKCIEIYFSLTCRADSAPCAPVTLSTAPLSPRSSTNSFRMYKLSHAEASWRHRRGLWGQSEDIASCAEQSKRVHAWNYSALSACAQYFQTFSVERQSEFCVYTWTLGCFFFVVLC